MSDRNDRHSNQAMSSSTAPKRLGSYLIEAGLLTSDQINVILNDQQATGMRFGEIIVARGWLKEQTIEWIVEKVIEPERQTLNVQPSSTKPSEVRATQPAASVLRSHSSQSNPSPTDRQNSAAPLSSKATATFSRRDAPIAKPLPSVNAADNGVYWVG